jgi:hypothetical protein
VAEGERAAGQAAIADALNSNPAGARAAARHSYSDPRQQLSYSTAPGRAVQVYPMNPMFEAPKSKRLTLIYDEERLSIAFNFDLRRYTVPPPRPRWSTLTPSTRPSSNTPSTSCTAGRAARILPATSSTRTLHVDPSVLDLSNIL